MAYNLTPAERRARAQELVQQRKNVVAYKNYLRQQRNYERQVEQAKLDEENRQKQINSMDFFTRAVSTIGDLASNVITGALKGLEGIYDLGVGLTGAIGGIFSKEFQDTMQAHIATDWVGTYIGNPLQELHKYSYTKNGGIIESVASGIGQMLPAVVVSIATAGAGAPAAVAEMASLATLGASAAGNSTEEAYNDGASYYAGLGYGLASGAVEVATEKMFGGFGKLTGAGYLDDVTRSIAKQGAARIAKEAVEEGLEEVASELVNPALKSIYKGGEAFNEYLDTEYWKGVGKAGLVGGLTSMAYGQTVGRVMHTSGKYADISEARAEYESLKKKSLNLEETGRIDETTKNRKTNRQNLYESKVENIRLIEETIKKVKEENRAKFIKKAGLEGIFNTDGSVNAEYAMREGLWSLVEQSTAEGDGKPVRPLASQPERYRTAFSDESAMQEALERGNTKPFVGEMTAEQVRDFGDFKKVFGKLANKSEGYLKFIVSEATESGNAYFDPQTGTVVIGIDQFGKGTSGVELANAVITSDMWQKSSLHEVKHSTEGAKNDSKLNEHLYSDSAVYEAAIDSFIDRGYLEHRVGQDKAKAREYIESLIVKYSEVVGSKPRKVSMSEWLNTHLTAEEIQDFRTAQSEVAAIAAENVLGNESFIKKLIREDTNIVQKILNRISDMKEAFSSFKSREARNAYTYLQKAEKLYLKAIEEVGGHFSKGRIIGIRQPREQEEVDASPQIVYNEGVPIPQESRKFSFEHQNFPTEKESGSEANRLAIWWASKDTIEAGDQTLISMNDRWYIVEKFDDATNHYQVEARITKSQYDKIAKEIADNGRSGKVLSIQRSTYNIDKLDRQGYSVGGEGQSSNGLQVGLDRQNPSVQQVGQGESQRGQAQSDSGRNSEGGGQSQQVKRSLKPSQEESLKKRGIKGDKLLDCIDLADEILDVGGEITPDAKAVLYHATSEQNARAINATGKMFGKEPNLYFSTKKDGVILGYGDSVVRVEIPLEKLKMNDLFEDEAHLTMEVRPYEMTNIRFSLKEGEITEAKLKEIRQESNEAYKLVNEAKKALDMIEGYEEAKKRLEEAIAPKNATNEQIDAAIAEYAKWEKESGYGEAYRKYNELQRQARELSREAERAEETLAKKLYERTFTEEEVRDYVAKAVRKFHTTTRLELAGYLTTTGSMLDFSERQGYRVQDHREISDILNLPDYAQYSTGMIMFMNMGNIRLQSYGIDIAAMPTEQQVKALRGIISQMMREYDEFCVDFSTKTGNTDGSVTYPKGTSFERIISDIRKYFTDGTIPEAPSDTISQFHYSNDGEGDIKFSLRTKEPPKKTIKAYKVFYAKDGGLYPPMVANPNGEATPIGVWLDADIGESAGVSKTGRKQVKSGGKGTQGGSGALAFRPGWHLGEYPLATQFNRLNPETGRKELFPADFVWAECEIAADIDYQEEAMSYGYTENGKFRHSYAGLPKLPTDGYYTYRTNPDPSTVPWYITGAMKVTRILNDDDVREILKKLGKEPLQRQGGDIDLSKYGLERGEVKVSKNTEGTLIDLTTDQKENPNTKLSKKGDDSYSIDESRAVMKKERIDYLIEYSGATSPSYARMWITSINPTDFINLTTQRANQDRGLFDTRAMGDHGGVQGEYNYDEALTSSDYRNTPYLEIDTKTGKVGYFDGRHRMRALEMRGVKSAEIYVEFKNNGIDTHYNQKGDILETIESMRVVNGRGTRQSINLYNIIPLNENHRAEIYENYGEETSRSDSDIKFSRKRTPVEEIHHTYYKLSDGQIKKLLANNTHYKVYSKVDAEQIINNVLSQYMSFGEKYGEISGKSKAEVIDMLWKGLNAAEPGKQMGVALHIADYIIQNSVLESIYSDEDAQVAAAIDIIDALKPYLHSINLDSLKGEIKHKYDRDNSPHLLWGKRKGENGLGVDQIAQVLEESGIHFDAINEADIFFEIDAQYRNAVKALKRKAKEMLAASLPEGQLKTLKQEIAREVLRGFDYTGQSSKLSEVLAKYKKQISTLYEKLKDANRHNKATNRLLDKVQKIRNWKTGAFVNASKYRGKLFQGSIERLGLIKNRGNLNQSGTRRILAGLAEWYTQDNPILGYVDAEHRGYYNEEIASILQAVSQNLKPLTDEQIDLITVLQEKSGISDYKGLLEWYTKDNLKKGYSAEVKSLLRELASETTFTTEELIALDKAIGYFGNLIENHNKVIRNGKYVDAKPIAERYINTLRANKTVKVGWFGKFFDKVANNGKASYLQTFADPMTVARYMDRYESGFFTEMLQEIRDGAIRADVLEMNIRLPLEEFLAKHKKYGRGVSKRKVTYRGVELPALDAFLLYMTLNREQALAGLAEAGFAFNDGKETRRVNGFAKGEDLTLDELRERARAEQEDLYKQFTEEDKEYISIAEKIFIEDCKEAKIQTDIARMGYSNVVEGYYIPIHRYNSAITIDTGTYYNEGNRVSNASFNKDTVKGAKGEILIEGLDEVLDRHIHGMSQYASLATVIDQYNTLLNLNMTEDANKPQTVRTESENTWAKGVAYYDKLVSDVQGISPTRGGGSKLFGFLRGGYAKYQLGLNSKVWLTQLSSIFASSSILDYSSIVKGFGIKSPDVDDYCSLAAVRNNDNSAAMAQSVLDKVDKFGSALMKPIGKVDRFVIKRLFGACQVQVQKENGLKVGTKENKIKAGELLEKVILETQQNSMATERSAAMRSGSELMKTLTMFTADSMKVFGRVVDSFGEVSVLKHKIKEATDPKVKESLQAQLKAANKKARKSVTALAATAIFMALVAQAFRWLYDKDDDDESVLETMTVDAIGNLMGGLPLIKDIYAKLTEGYDLNNYAYSAINDLFDAFASIVNFSEGKPAQKVKNIVYAVGQVFGIPTRNVYNIFYGLTKRFSPTTAYEIDNVFYNKNYSADLQKAIDNDDEDMIATITGLMLNEKVGSIESETAKRELNSLVAAGYKVLPRSIGNSITYNGEEIALTSRQREQFKMVYSEANNALASLVEGKAYRSATEEVKAKAIAFIWDIYYNLAIEDLLGVDLETKNTLFAKAIDISSLAIIVATARGMEADTDRNGKAISGSRKAKVQGYINSLGLTAAQKYMIMGYLGYTNKKGETQVRSYIQRLRLSKSEKEKLFSYSGYAA